MTTDSKEMIEMIEKTQDELKSAQSELSNWENHDAQREDGSQAQDRRNAERGERLRQKVQDLTADLRRLQQAN